MSGSSPGGNGGIGGMPRMPLGGGGGQGTVPGTVPGGGQFMPPGGENRMFAGGSPGFREGYFGQGQPEQRPQPHSPDPQAMQQQWQQMAAQYGGFPSMGMGFQPPQQGMPTRQPPRLPPVSGVGSAGGGAANPFLAGQSNGWGQP